jgi:integrase
MKERRRGQNEGSIFQRDDGRWCGVQNVGYQSGKRVRKYFYAATAAEVQDKLTNSKSNSLQGLPVIFEKNTVAEFLTGWLEQTVKPNVRPLTYQQYQAHVRLYLIPEIGRVKIARLQPQHVQAAVNRLLSRAKATYKPEPRKPFEKAAPVPPDKKLSPRTVQLALVVLKHALSQAVKWNLIARNVAALVGSPRVKRRAITPFNSDQARAFAEAIPEKRFGPLYLTALMLGLRQGEVLGLRWSDVDFTEKRLTVSRAIERIRNADGKGSSLQFVEPKTDRSRRTISLPDSIIAALKTQRARQAQARLLAGADWKDKSGDLIFTTKIGTPIEPRNLYRDFRGILADAKLPMIRFHDLRHSAASLLLAQGAHPRLVMELLGHSKISTTMDTYSHVIPAMMKDVADKMESIFTGAAR